MPEDKKSEILAAYTALTKKYSLPPYEQLNQDFEIETLEQEAFLLRAIRNRITEKMEYCIKLLMSILQPEQNITDLYECRMFTDEQKKSLYSLYKNLMVWMRAANILSIESTEKEEAEYLKKFYQEWTAQTGQRCQLKNVLMELKDSWSKETDVEDELGYLG